MWLHSELWRQDQDSVIRAVIKGPALLNPGNDLLEKDLGILDELVSSKEGSIRDQCSLGQPQQQLCGAHFGW
jgi:hypothetical protein